MRGLDRQIKAVEARIKTAVAEYNTSLLELLGVGPVLTATFLGEVGDIGRFPTKHHFTPTPAPPRWRPPAARSSATGCRGQGTANSTTPCT